MDENKRKLIEIFRQNVKGKCVDVTGKNIRHDGKKGHWLEEQFGIKANGLNEADIFGYELKNETTSGKITFGDWSANEYIFNDISYNTIFFESKPIDRRNRFLHIFGKPNVQKGNRYSWSGEPCPKYGTFNSFGQRITFDDILDIVVEYSYSMDQRINKEEIVPCELQLDNLVIARWYGLSSHGKKGKCLKEKLEDKFNNKGWFTCKTDINGFYDKICFGLPMNYESWVELVKKGIVFFDSGMYETNPRPYSQWRANESFWDSLIYEIYE